MYAGQFPSVDATLLIALLAASSVLDVAVRRIPNALPVSIFALGVVHSATTGGAGAALVNAGTALLVGAVLVAAWRVRLLGGGDVKLAAACLAWLGPAKLATFLAATAIAGGAIALLTLGASLAGATGGTGSETTLAARLRVPRAKVPYGAAIAFGALFAAVR